MSHAKIISLEDATAALTQAESVLARWTGEVDEQKHTVQVLAAELAEAQARAADDLLDADDDGYALARVAQALDAKQRQQGLAVQAAERAAERLYTVRRDVLMARAGAVRSRAEGLCRVVTARQARADQMLAELADFEGVAFGPAARPDALGLVGAGFTPQTLTQRVAARAQWLANHACGMEQIAADGADDQVLSWLVPGLPELDDAEALVSEPAGV